MLLPLCAAPVPAQESAVGRVAGQVVDRDTGRPLPHAQVVIVGTQVGAVTDLDGRYITRAVPLGTYAIRAMRIGYAPAQVDSVSLIPAAARTVDFALASAPVSLTEVEISAAPTVRATSEGALLAMQKAAPAVSDGISAEAIARSPDSDAADAIARVTGVSIVDSRFVIVRGLEERYSNTQLNGVELASPEPLKKVVPLDIFPASLVESIVTVKTATPDKPGDFAGGSVEIRTKEFPENRVLQFSLSQGYNSLSTFEAFPFLRRSGAELLGFDDGTRAMPAAPPPGDQVTPADLERFAESLRNVWTPPVERAMPNLGMNLTLGDQIGDEHPLGYSASLTYSANRRYTPDRFYSFVSNPEGQADRGFVSQESQSTVDWGGVFNLSYRHGMNHKFGWKNLYTRNAEETFGVQSAFETYRGPEELRRYQARYLTRQLVQSQLTGDHLIEGLFGSRIEWKLTAAEARRDEPDNRSASYVQEIATGSFSQVSSISNYVWFRFLTDRVYTGSLDLAIPLSLSNAGDAMVKVGGLHRIKDRQFHADLFAYAASSNTRHADILKLAPELAFAPENVGGGPGAPIWLRRLDALALPYASDDDLTAGYAMIDAPIGAIIRLVGGARAEHWMLRMRPGAGDPLPGDTVSRDQWDVLGSMNLTLSLSDRTNLRLAAYQTVARPDPRELSEDFFVAVTGECGNQGDPGLQRTKILNGDIRWEMYPGAGELFALSAFAKSFQDPIVEVVSTPQATDCLIRYSNADRARNIGAEVELRKSLDFVSWLPEGLSAHANLTLVRSRATLLEEDGGLELELQGQSPYIVNAGMLYARPGGRLVLSVLANAFGDRITRYGATVFGDNGVIRIPHVQERARIVLDAKAQTRLFERIQLSVSARNLTNQAQRFFQESTTGRVQTGFIRTGVSVSLGIGYDL